MFTPLGTLVVVMALGQQPQQDDRLKDADAVKAAWTDALNVPPARRPDVRWLTLHNLTVMERLYYRPILNGYCNKLSRRQRIEAPVIAGKRGELLRIDLTHYGWTAELWDKLADPYFTEQDQDRYEDVQYGHQDPRTGKWTVTRTERKKVAGKGIKPSEHLYRDPATALAIKDLTAWTVTAAPVVRADWFLNQTAVSQDRAAGYHEWLGFKDEATFAELVGVKEELSRKRRFEMREAVGESGVATHRVRAIVRDDAFGGSRWKTLDFDNPKDAFDALTVFGRDIDKVKWAASEQYGFLPNGLWAVGAFNRQGKLAKFVPGEVANDHASRSNDKRIHNGASCFRCHTDGGLQDIDEWARGAALVPPLKVDTADYEKYVELREQYLTDLQGALTDDRARYERAVKLATGLTSKEDAKRFAEFWELYEDARVTTEHAARDMGLPADEFRERLIDYLKVYRPPSYDAKAYDQFSAVAGVLAHKDLVIEGVLVQKRARSIPIHQYEEVLPQLRRASARPSLKSQAKQP